MKKREIAGQESITTKLGFGRLSSLLLGAGVLAAGIFFPTQVAGQGGANALSADQKKLDAEYKKTIWPMLEESCLPCHSGEGAKGGLDFEKYKGVGDVLADQDRWERVIQNVKSEVMPPPSMPQFSAPKREELIGWIQRVYSSNCELIYAGKVTIRRLNRAEYNYSVQDLLGVDLSPADEFPSDDVGYGFDNIGDVLSLSPLHMEKYMKAARSLSEAAIPLPESNRRVCEITNWSGSTGINVVSEGSVNFFTRAFADWNLKLAKTGNYELKISAAQMPGGPQDAQMLVGINGQFQHVINVKNLYGEPAEYKIPLELAAGELKVTIGFGNDFYDPNGPEGRKDRNLVIYGVELVGPEGAGSTKRPESYRKVVSQVFSAGNEFEVMRAALADFGARAYRRPLEATEIERLMALYRQVRKNGDSHEWATQICVQAILVNPNFLFRVELDHNGKSGTDRQLSGYELASRLSYFLWSSVPDSELRGLAESGQILDEKVLEKQVQRMLLDKKSERLGKQFALQWLELKRIVEVSPDPELFGAFSEALKTDMLTEVELFFRDMVTQNRPLIDFVKSEDTYLNDRLAAHYVIPGITGSQFRKVNVKAHNRGGVFGMGAVLTVTSNPNRTSPVKRGKWVMEAILDSPPPPPPPNVGVLADDKQAITTKNIRQRMDQHRSNPACAGCHKPLDAIGFSMENFDAVGRWRTKDGVFDVDASGEMPSGQKISGVGDLKRLIVERQIDFERALVTKMLTYAVGRGMNAADGCLVDEIAEKVKKRGNKMQDLILEIVNSDAFKKKTITGGKIN